MADLKPCPLARPFSGIAVAVTIVTADLQPQSNRSAPLFVAFSL
jgi:hypothetical protein